MKRIVLFLLFACNAVNAQEKGDFEIGLSAGLNSSHATSFTNDPKKLKFGINVTLSSEYYFSESWGIKTKFVYDQKGWTNAFLQDVEEIDVNIIDWNVNYLTLPILITHHAGANRNFHMHLGPYIGVLLDAEADNTGEDLSFALHAVDLGISFAFGYKVYLTESVKLFTEIEFSPGLIEIFAIENNIDYTIVNGRTSLSFGVLFEL